MGFGKKTCIYTVYSINKCISLLDVLMYLLTQLSVNINYKSMVFWPIGKHNRILICAKIAAVNYFGLVFLQTQKLGKVPISSYLYPV